MLIKVHNDHSTIEEIVSSKCGKKYSIIDRILKKNFGSSRYRLKTIYPQHSEIDLNNYTDSIFLNFDLRNNGLVFYFRYKNTEYLEFCAYHSLTFQTSDTTFVIQTEKFSYNFEIYDIKSHKKFILKIYEFKNKIA